MKRRESSRFIRHRRLRAKIYGTAKRPRLSVFRSHLHIYAQLIDDARGVTLVSASDRDVHAKKSSRQTSARLIAAQAVGKLIAERARAHHITAVVFDRGGYAYHGRVKAIAEGAREEGLEF